MLEIWHHSVQTTGMKYLGTETIQHQYSFHIVFDENLDTIYKYYTYIIKNSTYMYIPLGTYNRKQSCALSVVVIPGTQA